MNKEKSIFYQNLSAIKKYIFYIKVKFVILCKNSADDILKKEILIFILLKIGFDSSWKFFSQETWTDKAYSLQKKKKKKKKKKERNITKLSSADCPENGKC